jgi:DNA repair protein RecO (recombination protein O)
VASGEAVRPDARYHYVMERGPLRAADGDTAADPELSGQTLIDIDADDYRNPVTAAQSKLLMRSVLNHYLGDRPLHTRQLLKDLQKL